VMYGHEATMAPVPPSGQSIKRCSGNTGFMQTGKNAQDFVVTPLPTLSFLAKEGPACKNQDSELPPPEPDPAGCPKVIISEILPNPSGIDKGQEFIELHNPTDQPINVKGCSLRLGGAGKPYILPNHTLEAGEYRAFYETQTAIVLPNKIAQTVWLIDQEYEQGIRYGDNLNEGQSWSLFEGWGVGLPTPNEPNQQPSIDAGKGAVANSEACPEGKERNPGTNRCRIPPSDEPLAPCPTDQTRNPATGRCRMITTAKQSTLTPCKPGQERNSVTNRCRTVASTATETLQPCAAGQERNPETNRCRKIPTVVSTPHIEDKQSPPVTDPKWWFIGLIIAGLLGYGIYEWRHEIRKAWQKLKHTFTK